MTDRLDVAMLLTRADRKRLSHQTAPMIHASWRRCAQTVTDRYTTEQTVEIAQPAANT